MMPPILVAGLFPQITAHLLDLLRSLALEEWRLPTVSSRRTVKDIASHLLDGSLRRLSMQRDGYRPSDGCSLPRAGESLLDFLNRLNDEWEVGTRRLSPHVLVQLIEWADSQLAELFASLDPEAQAIFPVGWAGEEQSKNWMDVARDYTEKWHHTQQIFEATGRASTIMTRELGHPCFDIFMRALPFTFRNVDAEVGSIVLLKITGDAGGSWFIQRQSGGWEQMERVNGLKPSERPTAIVTMDQDTAWKLVTKRRNRDVARHQFSSLQIEGDVRIGSHVFDMVSVMA